MTYIDLTYFKDTYKGQWRGNYTDEQLQYYIDFTNNLVLNIQSTEFDVNDLTQTELDDFKWNVALWTEHWLKKGNGLDLQSISGTIGSIDFSKDKVDNEYVPKAILDAFIRLGVIIIDIGFSFEEEDDNSSVSPIVGDGKFGDGTLTKTQKSAVNPENTIYSSLTTTDKTIIGAINETQSNIDEDEKFADNYFVKNVFWDSKADKTYVDNQNTNLQTQITNNTTNITNNKNDISNIKNGDVNFPKLTLNGDTITNWPSGGGDAEFLDGTKTKDVDISQNGEITKLRVSTSGKTFTIAFDPSVEHVDFDGLELVQFRASKIDFNGKDANLTYLDEDGGKLKENGVVIHDANETTYNVKALSALNDVSGNSFTLNGDTITSWPSGGGATFKTGESVGEVSLGEGGSDPATNLITEEVGEANYAKKLNYTSDETNPSKMNFYATGENEEIRVQFDQTPIMNFKQSGIEMLNGQIDKVVPTNSDTQLVNKAEVLQLISEAGIGEFKEIYNNGTLTAITLPDGINSGYSFSGDGSNLDQFTQSGQDDFVAVPRSDLYFSTEKNKPFYEFSIVADFSSLFSGTLWLEDSLLVTKNNLGKPQNKSFVVFQKARQNGTDIIYNQNVYRFDIAYLVFDNGSEIELQIAEQIDYIKETYTSPNDTNPTIRGGTWITSDQDFRVNETSYLDVGSGSESEEWVIKETNVALESDYDFSFDRLSKDAFLIFLQQNDPFNSIPLFLPAGVRGKVAFGLETISYYVNGITINVRLFDDRIKILKISGYAVDIQIKE